MEVNTVDRSSDPRRLAEEKNMKENKHKKYWLAFKITCFLGFVICQCAFERSTIGVRADDDWYDMHGKAVFDKALEATKGINERLTKDENLWQLKLLMIFCGALMDTMICTLFIHWTIRGDSARLFAVYLGFYGLRAICMAVYAV
jgi:hypothetical protein